MLSQSGITLRTGGYASGSLSAEPIPNPCCTCRSDYAYLRTSREISGQGLLNDPGDRNRVDASAGSHRAGAGGDVRRAHRATVRGRFVVWTRR